MTITPIQANPYFDPTHAGQFLEISDAEVEHVKDVDCAYFEDGIEMSFISDTQLRSERIRLKDVAKGTSLDFDL